MFPRFTFVISIIALLCSACQPVQASPTAIPTESPTTGSQTPWPGPDHVRQLFKWTDHPTWQWLMDYSGWSLAAPSCESIRWQIRSWENPSRPAFRLKILLFMMVPCGWQLLVRVTLVYPAMMIQYRQSTRRVVRFWGPSTSLAPLWVWPWRPRASGLSILVGVAIQ